MRLTNTLSGQVEDLRPLAAGRISMYSCGPTVYDYQHIGNFRTFVFVDLRRRGRRLNRLKLDHVMNITDVDDKIIRNATEHNMSVRDYAVKFEKAFLEDMQALNLERPEHVVRATEHINGMATFIAALVKKGFAYRTDD